MLPDSSCFLYFHRNFAQGIDAQAPKMDFLLNNYTWLPYPSEQTLTPTDQWICLL